MPEIYKKILDLRNMYLIKKSGYFDKDYYKNEYPDVKGNLLKHYYYYGYKLGNNPSAKFYNNYYLDHNSDIKNSGINPLLHYVVSGQKEGREIRKYLGMSISELYYYLYQEDYFCNIYFKNDEKKRITLFLENDFSDDLVKLVINLINLCKKNKMRFRIVYKNFDINQLFFELKNKKVNDLCNLIFLKWNSKYLLEVDLDEKIICGNFSMLHTLVNTKMISAPIYYYISDNSMLSEEEQMFLSLWVQNNKVICVGEAKLYQYQLVMEDNLTKLSKDFYNLCFDFVDMSLFMLQMYNDFFLNSWCLKKFKFCYRNKDICKRLCFDNNVVVPYVSNFDDVDIVIRFGYEKLSLLDIPCINIYFDKIDKLIKTIKVEDIILEGNNDIQKMFDIELNQRFKKIGIGEDNV